MTPTILVVEDEPAIQELVTVNLKHAGFLVVRAGSAEDAESAIRAALPDLVILDWMLPGQSGVALAKKIRADERTRELPIIMLTARVHEEDKVQGLEAGADDYVTKPFSPQELLARVRAGLRRTDAGTVIAGQIVRGDLTIDVDRRRVVRGVDEIRLTPKEFELMVFLAQHADRVLTHKAILRAIWGPNAVNQPEHLRVLVNALRKKIEPDPTQPRYIVTEPWVGYRFQSAL